MDHTAREASKRTAPPRPSIQITPLYCRVYPASIDNTSAHFEVLGVEYAASTWGLISPPYDYFHIQFESPKGLLSWARIRG
jgi:hypothetical protein